MFKIIQIVIGAVLIAMVWLNSGLQSDQKLAFTVLIVLLLLDKFIKLDRVTAAQPSDKHDN
jgi:hypothetical protein